LVIVGEWPSPDTLLKLRCRCREVVATAGAVVQEYLRENQ
jgi:hypothetical protein